MEEKVGAGKSVTGMAAAAAVVLALLAAPHRADAMTADGAIMTNTALATYTGIGGVGIVYRVSYLATASVLICNPLIVYVKTATPTMVAPTQTVVFTVCTINNSVTTSAFNITITDKIPDNMAFFSGGTSPAWTYGGTGWTVSYAATLAGPWTAGMPAVGTTNNFLRWVMRIDVGPGKSACVTYTASVL